jgi:hypothetical protein
MTKMTDEQKQEVIDAVMLCDFSEIIDKHFHVGQDMPAGLGRLLAVKAKLKKDEDWHERLKRILKRLAWATETLNIDQVELYTAQWRKLTKR